MKNYEELFVKVVLFTSSLCCSLMRVICSECASSLVFTYHAKMKHMAIGNPTVDTTCVMSAGVTVNLLSC